MEKNKLNVVLCWHMHQPWYRNGLEGEYRLPWVYLHAIKDYSDMAMHLERHPEMRAVVNFAPVLLEQLDDYAQQLQALLQTGRPTKDPLLNLLAGITAIPADEAGRSIILQDCQRAHAPRMIQPWTAFQSLLDMVGAAEAAGAKHPKYKHPLLYLGDQYFLDVITWYHLAWLGQSLRQQAAVQALITKAQLFNQLDRYQLLEVIANCLSELIPRYRALAERDQVELSMTPYMHPIIPLLQDFSNMKCALPSSPSPQAEFYPEGRERARWHMQRGLECFEKYFGRRPQGVWLSEGGISASAVALLDEFGIRWTASGEGVWRNSSHLSGYYGEAIDSKRDLFKPHRLPDSEVRMHFRDDGLSDLIGFKYSNWNANDAVKDFIQHLENTAQFLDTEASQHTLAIILDGENAWEYYPNNAVDFLDQLYAELNQSALLKTACFADLYDSVPSKDLAKLCAGSWVYGSFSTWIGSEDKNRGWDYLVAAKHAYDQAITAKRLSSEQEYQATQQLAICEGSDWFWWFGDYNPSESVRDFERLFRLQLKQLYHLLSLEPPTHLDIPLSQGGQGADNAGTMRRNT
ncbi:Alpha-amylase/alpha-mannosidase, GH57 family [Thiothrix eikelboomii]|uniref:Alpha-amylase/alpha-mannosidase, GH57 family n=1 Tax=Thiothrix eikelboomii TaxID=92487 RepID=A0A1T4WEM2_9GAMM|nr:glycoside hydrolase family 57 protein [Thiothrix eikelboomii]SKA75772.1 Alpha-amylase/alpha-mannosidase, GH57 family [Thiothrix eikelboomii]